MFFVFGSVYVMGMFIDLCILNQPYIPGMKSTSLWWISFLMCCCSVLLRIFTSEFIRDIGLKFSFFVVSLPGFWYQYNAGFIK